MPVYDALYKRRDLHHVLTRHEQGAGHAAAGYARASGRVGVAMATSGPGALNLVTALADAMMDATPVVAITGQVPTSVVGTDAFQEADVTGVTMPITKHNYLVTDVHDLPRVVAEAFHIAATGRPGPVLIDLPKDVQNAEFTGDFPENVDLPGYKPVQKGHPRQVEKALRALKAAERLAAEGIPVRVVSLPSFELFEAQDPAYREAVLGPRPRLAVEAGATLGWERYADAAVGLDRFGASAPGPEVYARLGFTEEAVAERFKALLAAFAGEPPVG
jgi:hypothetical protein